MEKCTITATVRRLCRRGILPRFIGSRRLFDNNGGVRRPATTRRSGRMPLLQLATTQAVYLSRVSSYVYLAQRAGEY